MDQEPVSTNNTEVQKEHVSTNNTKVQQTTKVQNYQSEGKVIRIANSYTEMLRESGMMEYSSMSGNIKVQNIKCMESRVMFGKRVTLRLNCLTSYCFF